MSWGADWNLTSREQWEKARARGRGSWVRRKLAWTLVVSVFAVLIEHRHYANDTLLWLLVAALVYANGFTAWLLCRMYDNAERRHKDPAES